MTRASYWAGRSDETVARISPTVTRADGRNDTAGSSSAAAGDNVGALRRVMAMGQSGSVG
jgi:hypothetical protein